MPLATAIIANTDEEAPRRPAHEINRHWGMLQRNGRSSKKTATGLAINVKNTTIANAGRMTYGI